jgi:hypothetical protein
MRFLSVLSINRSAKCWRHVPLTLAIAVSQPVTRLGSVILHLEGPMGAHPQRR